MDVWDFGPVGMERVCGCVEESSVVLVLDFDRDGRMDLVSIEYGEHRLSI